MRDKKVGYGPDGFRSINPLELSIRGTAPQREPHYREIERLIAHGKQLLEELERETRPEKRARKAQILAQHRDRLAELLPQEAKRLVSAREREREQAEAKAQEIARYAKNLANR